MSHSNIYFNFLLLCEDKKICIQKYSAHCSSELLALFDQISQRHAINQTMTISQTTELHHLGSSATLHKRIDDLREAGMIQISFKDKNRRTKYLEPSRKGQRYLTYMGQLLRIAIKQTMANKQGMCLSRQTLDK